MMRMRTKMLFAVAFGVFAAGLFGLVLGQTGSSVKNPHKKLTLPCESCHVPVSFHTIEFDHAKTRFPLAGKHDKAKCLSCHSVENFSLVGGACVSCHEDVHAGSLGVDCERCHSPRGWSAFEAEEIHAQTNFPLAGRHLLADCLSCHHEQLPNRFAETPTQCYSCHQAQYEAASNPDHVATGFPTDCEQCHGFFSWRPAVMPEHDGFFPIFSGTHRDKWEDCSTCHTTPGNPRVFSCLTCHEHDQAPMDGVHQGIPGYAYASAQCYDCHPTGEKGRFTEHDGQFFPIYSGTHTGTWSDCAVCHTDPSTRAVFDCLTCHEHDQTPMDGAHQGITGYAYASAQCYACHPTGQKGRFVEHDAQFFPIYSGVHNGTWSSCATCHTDPTSRAVFSCLTCHEHAQAQMDEKHREVQGYSYTSAACYSCHPTGRHE